MEVAELRTSKNLDKYLGLPSFIGSSRLTAFKGIVDMASKKLGNWKKKFISKAGKEILIKAILQAIPTYSMSVFLLLMSLCKQLNSIFVQLWLGH